MDTDITVKNYLESLESSSPTPGGGNVSAFCGVLSSALGKMVCGLTIGKKKYLDVEEKMKEYQIILSEYKSAFEALALKDNEAFDLVMNAFKLPKETDEQKEVRHKSIENATKGAAEIPFKVIMHAKKTLDVLEVIADKGNKNSISDAGVAVLLLQTAAKGAFLNVIINCSSLNDKEFAEIMIKDASDNLNDIELKCNTIFNKIKKDILNEN